MLVIYRFLGRIFGLDTSMRSRDWMERDFSLELHYSPRGSVLVREYSGWTYVRTPFRPRGPKLTARSGFPPSWTLAALPPFEMNSPEEVDGRYKLVRDAVCPRGGYIVLTCRLFVVEPDARPLMSRKKRAIILGSCRKFSPRVPRYVRALPILSSFSRSGSRAAANQAALMGLPRRSYPRCSEENYFDELYDRDFHKGETIPGRGSRVDGRAGKIYFTFEESRESVYQARAPESSTVI